MRPLFVASVLSTFALRTRIGAEVARNPIASSYRENNAREFRKRGHGKLKGRIATPAGAVESVGDVDNRACVRCLLCPLPVPWS